MEGVHGREGLRVSRRPSRELVPEPIWYLKGVSYGVYRQSEWWRIRRAAFLDSHPFPLTCDNCGIDTLDYIEDEHRPPRFDVHHLSYDHLGDERDEDLQLLCHPCHNMIDKPESAAAMYWRAHLNAQALLRDG